MPDYDDERVDGLSLLAHYLLGEETLVETLTRVVDIAKRDLVADMAGITMLVGGQQTTAVFTDDEAPEIDKHQYTGGSGPCVEAFRTNVMVAIHDVPGDDRWPEFTAVAAKYGVLSTLSLPLSGPGEAFGALNLYARRLDAFAPRDKVSGTKLALQAAVVLRNARVYSDSQELNDNLKQALNSRAEIDYAIGILMADGGHDPSQAFELLVRASQRENRKLRDIAGEVVIRARTRRRGDLSSSAGPTSLRDRPGPGGSIPSP